jgi:hypothetical protein
MLLLKKNKRKFYPMTYPCKHRGEVEIEAYPFAAQPQKKVDG